MVKLVAEFVEKRHPLTSTHVEKLRRLAKKRRREHNADSLNFRKSHAQFLNEVAIEEGFVGWEALIAAADREGAS